MIRVARRFLWSIFLCAPVLVQKSEAQSIINPSDPVVEYNPAAPPTPPTFFNPLVKWVRTLNVAGGAVQARNPGWNSNVYKAYNYKGLSFRVQFPKTYNPTASDGKKYPIIVFLHGQGENDNTYLGPPPPGGGSYNYDDQFQLLQGPPQFDAAIQNNIYDGYVLAIQLQNNISSPPTVFYQGILNDIMNIVKYMIANNKVDPFHIVVNGLSEGGVGSWEMLNLFPTYISSAIPMSSPVDFVNWANTGTYFSSKRFTPIWISQGGVDTHPTPAETQRVADTMTKYGSNFRLSFYPTLEHTTWYNIWAEQDFWPFINNSYSSNPWMLGGLKSFFPGQSINETIGITAGFSAYEWRKNGSIISGATSNTLNVTSAGVYDARVQRDGIWSDWSHVPINIRTGFYEAESWVAMNGVANESTSDVGGGQDVGYIENGDWMDYNVNAVAAGNYNMNFRVASVSAGQLQVRNSAGIVLATVSIPPTGGLQAWQTVSTNISLPAGAQTLRVYAATGGWNFNWFQIATGDSSTPPNPPPSVTTRIEAENYLNMSGVQKETTTDEGGGQNLGYIDTGDWMDYSLTISSAGTYAFNFRVASPVGGQIQIRNSSGTVLATIAVPNTGGWQVWQTVSVNIPLSTGTQTIRIYSASNGWNFNWMETSAPITSAAPPPPAGVRIEAEDYISMSGVAKETTADAGGGQNVGYIDTGDWMDYSVNIPAAGTFAINFRVSSPSGGQLQLKNSTGTLLATVSIPATGGWQNWQTLSANVTLPAGSQTIRVYSASNGWNFNWMEIATGTTTGNPPPPSPSSRIEAENYSNMNGVVKESTTDVGGGQNLGYIDSGDWMDYNINVTTAGTYSVNLRVASPIGGQLQIRTSNGTVLATVTVPNTGGWQNWQTASGNIALNAGPQIIRVYSASNGWNFNWFEFAGAGTVSAASASKEKMVSTSLTPVPAAINIYPNPVLNSCWLQITNDRTGNVSVQIYNIGGALQKQISLSKREAGSVQYNLPFGGLAKGNYIIKVTMNNWTDSKQISKQ